MTPDSLILWNSQDDVHATMLIEAASTTGIALFVGLTLGFAADTGTVYMRDDKTFSVEEVCLVSVTII